MQYPCVYQFIFIGRSWQEDCPINNFELNQMKYPSVNSAKIYMFNFVKKIQKNCQKYLNFLQKYQKSRSGISVLTLNCFIPRCKLKSGWQQPAHAKEHSTQDNNGSTSKGHVPKLKERKRKELACAMKRKREKGHICT